MNGVLDYVPFIRYSQITKEDLIYFLTFKTFLLVTKLTVYVKTDKTPNARFCYFGFTSLGFFNHRYFVN